MGYSLFGRVSPICFLVFSADLFFFVGVTVIFFGFVLSLGRLLKCLLVVEKFKVLLLFMCILSQLEESRMLFISLIVVFTIEVVLGLVVLTRIWNIGDLIGIVG